MPIELCDIPPSALEAVKQALLNPDARPRLPNLSRADMRKVSLSMPHQIAFLQLDSLRLGGLLLREAAHITGWRFLVYEARNEDKAANGVPHGTSVPIAAATAIKDGEMQYKLGELNEGPLVEQTAEGIRYAENLVAVQRGTFEILFLIAPAVYVAALWLKNREGNADLVMALPCSNPRLRPYDPITAGRFIETLKELAREVTI